MVTWAEFQNLNTVKRPSDLARAMASDLISFFFFFFFCFVLFLEGVWWGGASRIVADRDFQVSLSTDCNISLILLISLCLEICFSICCSCALCVIESTYIQNNDSLVCIL